MYVVVIGGGNVGYYLTKELLAAGHEVVMIEKDPGRARTIADELGSIVIPNDGCEGRYQAEAGMARADVIAAVTGDDEDNLVACQVAKMKFNVPRAIARVNNPSNEALFRRQLFDPCERVGVCGLCAKRKGENDKNEKGRCCFHPPPAGWGKASSVQLPVTPHCFSKSERSCLRSLRRAGSFSKIRSRSVSNPTTTT